MALSLLCGGLGVASASLDIEVVNQSGEPGAVTIYTKEGVDKALETKAEASAVSSNKKDIDNLKTAVGDLDSGLTKKVSDQKAAIDVNTASIDTNKAAIKSLQDDKLDKALATSTFAAKTELDAKANTDLSNLTADGETKIKNIMSADMEKKANKDTVTALGERVGGVEGKVTALENTVGNDSSGLVKEVNELKTQGATLNNALGSKADKTDLEDATDRITANEGKITELQTKTQKIKHDVANDTTSVNGMKVGQQQVDMGGKNLTNVGTINGINLGEKEGGNYISQDGSIWGNMKKVDTQVGTNTTAITALESKVGTVGTGTYLNPHETVGENLGRLNAGLEKEVGDRTAEDSKLSARIGTVTENGNYIKKSDTKNVSENLIVLDTQAKTNEEAIAKETADRKAAIGELAVNGNYIKKDKNVSDNLVELDKQAKANAEAITETNQHTAGITRDDTRKETSIEGRVTVDTNGNIKAEGTITSNGLDARAGEIKTTGKVSAGDVSTGTLETTGDATIGGTLNTKDVTAEKIQVSKSEENAHYKSEGSIIGEGGNLSVSNKKTDKRTHITKESQLNINEEGTVNWATSTDGTTGNVTEGRSEVTAGNIKNSVKKTEGGKTFGYEENITADGKVGTVTDKEGNTSTTRQDSKGVYGYAKDKDGNKSYTKQEGNRIAESVIGQDGKQTKSEMTSTDITNTAKDGTITNTAKNVTNEGTESVTNKVGNNEVKVSQNGVDIKAEDGKKITESVGTAFRVVENDKITDNAGDSTVTTEKDKGTTFGKKGSTGTTNIYGNSIKTGTINAEVTTTDKLTAGAAADADGGRLTVDANDGVQGSYKYGKYTSKSYILANTLKSGVDNGKKPTDTDFVGSRTDHYMDGDKAKLDETVKDAAGSNVTNKTSTGTVTTITDGTTTTKTEQTDSMVQSYVGKKDGSATNVTTNFANASANMVTEDGKTSTVLNNKDGLLVRNTANGKSFNTADGTNTGTALEWTNVKGNEISTGKVEANYVKMDYADVMQDLGVRGNAKIAGKTTTGSLEVTGTSTLTGDVTMGSNATVNGNFNVKGDTNLKNTKVDGTLNVTQKATFDDSVSIAKDLSVGGDVTANSYKVGDKTYIDKNGIHANGQKITDVADGSISEGSKDAVNGGQLYTVKNDLEGKVNKVGANAAAMANLHPMEFDPDSKWNIAAAIGNYGSETAAALGAFYRPNDNVMVNLSTAFGTGENMVGGVSVRLGKGGNKLSREETNALKAQVADLSARMDALLSVLNPNMSKDFPDVPENHWAYEAVSRLAGNDIVQGYPDGEFHGERTMTRYEMAEIIYNALSRGAEAERELVEEFKPELQAMAASEKATAEKAEG